MVMVARIPIKTLLKVKMDMLNLIISW